MRLLAIGLAASVAISVSISRPPARLEAGDAWSPVVTVKRAGKAVRGARVTISFSGAGERVNAVARPAGAGRYRAQLVPEGAGRWTYAVRVGGRTLRRGSFAVRPPRLRGAFDVFVDADGSLLVVDLSNRLLRARGGELEFLARLHFPVEVATDPRGGIGVVTEERFVRHIAANGTVRVVAELEQPTALAYAPDGTLYVSELPGRVRRVDVSGAVTTIVASELDRPHGLVVVGGTLYVCDTFDNELIAVDLSTGVVRTVSAELNTPVDVALARDGSLYVADYGNGRLARVTPAGTTSTLVPLLGVQGVAVGPDGAVYATERDRARVRRVDPATGAVTTIVGGP